MKTALVTGASGGLGQAICKVLAERGYTIIAIARTPQKELEARLSFLGEKLEQAIGGVDFSSPENLQKHITAILPHKNWSVLVNNAGVSQGGRLIDGTLEDWNTMLAVNLTAPFLLSQLFVQNAQAHNLKGSIVNISSMVGVVGAKKPGYAASKAGLIGLTKSIALQVGPNIRCNAIYPGAVDTPMIADWDAQTRETIAKNSPVGHIAHPEEIAKIVAFLADDNESSFMTGTALNATGGQYLGQ